jgi:hypothetical protein
MLLQMKQAVWQFDGSWVPPFAIATMWSMVGDLG